MTAHPIGKAGSSERGAGVSIIVNAKAGTARTLDREATLKRLREVAEKQGTVGRVDFVEPDEVLPALKAEAEKREIGRLIVGGGDGTISSAGNLLAGSDVAMGIIPLGTFNLFARAINMPLDFEEALTALETAEPQHVDVGDINGLVFLHAVSIGVHQQVIWQRDRMSYNGKVGKMLAGVRAWATAIRQMRSVSLAFEGDFTAPRRRYKQVAVTLGPLTEGMPLPLSERLTDGELGLLLLPESNRLNLIRAIANAALGRWRSNPYLHHYRVHEIIMRGRRPRFWVSVDGEMTRMVAPVRIAVRPGALTILRPKES